jgi:hypothetical protein
MPHPDRLDPAPFPTQPPPPDGLPPLDRYPCDIPIQSIADARRRLALVDGFDADLLEMAVEIGRLQREAIQAAGLYDVIACLDAREQEARLRRAPAPAGWDEAAMIDLVAPGSLCDQGRRYEQLIRLATFTSIPLDFAVRVMEMVGAAVNTPIGYRAAEALPHLREFEQNLFAARGEYTTLRDAIAGALDRMEADQLLYAGRRIDLGHGTFERPPVDWAVPPVVGAELPTTAHPDGFDGSAGSAGWTVPGAADAGPTPGDAIDGSDGGDGGEVGLPPEPDETIVPSTYTVRCTDQPENFPAARWAELSALRTFLGTADRFLNRSEGGRRWTGAVSLDAEYGSLLGELIRSPGWAGMRLHEKARDLWGNLRHSCGGLSLPDCPPLNPGLAGDSRWPAEIGLRDDVPRLRAWLTDVEAGVRAWAALQVDTSCEPIPETKPRRTKPALEDRPDEESVRLCGLYEVIIQARVGGEGPARRAERLSHNRDLADLARAAGQCDGITESLVRAADQFGRDRDRRRERLAAVQR